MKTRLLTPMQLKGLQKIGDACIPGDSEFPSFSALGCAVHIDDLLEQMPKSDVKDLKMLFGLMAWKPLFAIRGMFVLLDALKWLPGQPGNLVRMLRTGLKGITVTLYYSGRSGRNYSGKTPVQKLGYEVQVIPLDQ